MASTCQKCSKTNEGGARFCSGCGYDMSTGLTLQTPVSVPTVTAVTPHKTADPLIGAEIGGCVIDSKIGQGGMGAVYRGVQTSLERPVAIKILPPHLASNKAYIARFLRESKIVASIRHPNIVSVYDRGSHEEVYFFVMELIQGRTVGDVIAEKKTIRSGDALEITRQAALALSAAAAKNIIHRDIKPDNIMIDEGGIVKVTDFGLVKNTADATGGITATHQVMGTPAFMSPEQCKGDPADHRSDIYSLGMTLYAMLTGRPAFTAETTHGLLMKQITEQPTPPHVTNQNVPQSIWPLLSGMLDKNQDGRFADWPQVIQALDQLKVEYPDDYVISGILRSSSGGDYQRISGAPTTPSPMTPASITPAPITPAPTPASPLTFDLEKSTPVSGEALRPPTQLAPGAGSGKGVIIGICIGAAIALLAVVVILLLPRKGEKALQAEKYPISRPQTAISTAAEIAPESIDKPDKEREKRDKQMRFKTEVSKATGYMDSSKWDDAILSWERAKKLTTSKAEIRICEDKIKEAREAKREIDEAERLKAEKKEFEKLLRETTEAYGRRDIKKAEEGIAQLSQSPLGDKRVDDLADRIKLVKMVSVPAGTVTVGGRKQSIPAFEIGAYEVTNRQFREFIDAGGYSSREYWPGLAWTWRTGNGITQPRYWNDSKFKQLEQPVVGVSWYEAQAYCKWLSRIPGRRYRLPRIAEWKLAAEGPKKGSRWPWGDSEENPPANLRDPDQKSTTMRVGTFDKGKSNLGCFDIIGNAAEWCGTAYKCHSVGGSWLTFLEDVQTDPERPVAATLRSNRIGFRVVREGR